MFTEYKEEQQHWPCFECDQKFKSSGNLQKHLNVHDTKRVSPFIIVIHS